MREELEALASGRQRRRLGGRSAHGGRVGTLRALAKRGYIVRGAANGGYVITDAGRAALGQGLGAGCAPTCDGLPHWPILYAILRPAIASGNQAVLHHAQRLAEVLDGDQRAALRELLDRPAAAQAPAGVVHGAPGAQEDQHG